MENATLEHLAPVRVEQQLLLFPPELPPGPLTLLVCRVQQQDVALPVDAVEMILPLPELIPLPGEAPWVLGQLPFGEDAVTVLDLAALLAHQPRVPAREDRVVVCGHGGQRVGLVVQEIGGIRWALTTDLEPAPPGERQVLGVLPDEAAPVRVLGVPQLLRAREGA